MGYFGMCEDWDAQHWSFSESIVFCKVPVQPIRMCSVLTACQVHGGPASHMWHDVNFNRYDLKFQILNTFNFGWPLQLSTFVGNALMRAKSTQHGFAECLIPEAFWLMLLGFPTQSPSSSCRIAFTSNIWTTMQPAFTHLFFFSASL